MPPTRYMRKGKRQRFYARNAVKTTLDPSAPLRGSAMPGRVMRSFRTTPSYNTPIHPALTSFADECCATLARLFAYVGTLALIAIVGVHQWDQLQMGEAAEPGAKAGWSVALRSYPAFAVSQSDLPEKTATYEILRHPEGGRKDIMRWAAPSEKPVAELQIYRPGGEFGDTNPTADIAARMDPNGPFELEAVGVIDSKFGTVMLLRRPRDAGGCLGFLKRIDRPGLEISGWSCQGETLPARRAAIGCMLNRLILLTAGNEPKLAGLFARAELRRGDCGPAASSADWVTSAETPALRGGL